MTLKFKKLNPEAIIPTRGTPDSAGLDLSITLPSDIKNLTGIDNKANSNQSETYDIAIQFDKKENTKYIMIPPETTVLVPTGLAVEPSDTQTTLLVYPRSGLATKKGLILANSVAVIDSDYRGEIKIPLRNTTERFVIIKDHDRVAQLIITPVIFPDIIETNELSETTRNTGGFGSTGIDIKNIKNIENAPKTKNTKVLTVRDLIKNDNFDYNGNYVIYDCTDPGSTYSDNDSKLIYDNCNNTQSISDDILNMQISYITTSNCLLIIEAKKI